MSKPQNAQESRRRFLMLVGGSALAVPAATLTGCSSDEPAPPAPAEPAATPQPAAQGSAPTAAPEPAAEAPAAAPAADELPQLSESDPMATSLGYVHDVASVDTAKYPRYQAGQQCSNCALYQADADTEWAGCSIFPGKAVKATGWCSVYAPTAG